MNVLVVILLAIFGQINSRPADPVFRIFGTQADNPNVKVFSTYPTEAPRIESLNNLEKSNGNEDKYAKDALEDESDVTRKLLQKKSDSDVLINEGVSHMTLQTVQDDEVNQTNTEPLDAASSSQEGGVVEGNKTSEVDKGVKEQLEDIFNQHSKHSECGVIKHGKEPTIIESFLDIIQEEGEKMINEDKSASEKSVILSAQASTEIDVTAALEEPVEDEFSEDDLPKTAGAMPMPTSVEVSPTVEEEILVTKEGDMELSDSNADSSMLETETSLQDFGNSNMVSDTSTIDTEGEDSIQITEPNDIFPIEKGEKVSQTGDSIISNVHHMADENQMVQNSSSMTLNEDVVAVINGDLQADSGSSNLDNLHERIDENINDGFIDNSHSPIGEKDALMTMRVEDDLAPSKNEDPMTDNKILSPMPTETIFNLPVKEVSDSMIHQDESVINVQENQNAKLNEGGETIRPWEIGLSVPSASLVPITEIEFTKSPGDESSQGELSMLNLSNKEENITVTGEQEDQKDGVLFFDNMKTSNEDSSNMGGSMSDEAPKELDETPLEEKDENTTEENPIRIFNDGSEINEKSEELKGNNETMTDEDAKIIEETTESTQPTEDHAEGVTEMAKEVPTEGILEVNSTEETLIYPFELDLQEDVTNNDPTLNETI